MKKTVFILAIVAIFSMIIISCEKDDIDNDPSSKIDDKIPSNYCTPPSYTNGPYLGILEVTFGSINNKGAYNDGYTFYESIAATDVQSGSKYTITINTFNEISSKHNSRVWIDWNRDGDFDDSNELASSWNEHNSGLITNEIEVPTGASEGYTRMRVYTDMTTDMGHITPEPCGYLNHPDHMLGHHGEIEDYILYIRK